jgi:hypothetical protein
MRHGEIGAGYIVPGTAFEPALSDNIYFTNASSASVFMPNFFINQAGGQKPVKELWKQLNPTKRVSQVQFGLWNKANKDVSMTIIPPKANSVRSTDITFPPLSTLHRNIYLGALKRGLC